MNIELIPLHPEDKDISDLKKIHTSLSVAKYISISENYFDYVTNTDGAIYYKIIWNGILAGGVHCEYADGTMFMSVCVDELYRRRGIAEAALNQLFLTLTSDVDVIEVNIEETNVPSLLLFQKLGFSKIGKEDELITLRKLLRR